MCTMMQVQGSNMMDSMGGNPAAAFWGARHPSWPATSHASHQGSNATPNQDPKVAEKLMTELQVRFPFFLLPWRIGLVFGTVSYGDMYMVYMAIRRRSCLHSVIDIYRSITAHGLKMGRFLLDFWFEDICRDTFSSVPDCSIDHNVYLYPSSFINDNCGAPWKTFDH